MNCRFCHQHIAGDFGVTYTPRHHAHYECYLGAGKRLEDLPDHKILQFPWKLLRDHDLLHVAMAANERITEAAYRRGENVFTCEGQGHD